MSHDVYRYAFDEETSMIEVRDSLFLAIFCAEGLHGPARVRMDAGFHLDEKQQACVVDAATLVGRTVAQIFTALILRQFGDDAFAVERLDAVAAPCGDRRGGDHATGS